MWLSLKAIRVTLRSRAIKAKVPLGRRNAMPTEPAGGFYSSVMEKIDVL